ncbi:23 kDa integral membrane protein [Drosophila guanche]|uniref:Tetraspanin n=1 Tax=Drosophila guanche TaxID=7266 RepID=A0A3B0J241_DROGU|nr:23 kDa integral membrane protein [Drosophila guanche]SPP73072.1 blast:Tetraspanin-9 [Drosophila guanche]
MGCVSGILNFILYIVNIVFLIVGILLIVLGSIMLADIGRIDGYGAVESTNTIPICITVLGGLIFIVSFFGCYGLFRQSACMTGAYTSMIFVLFILQLVLTCWVFVNRSAFLQDMGRLVTSLWNNNDYDAFGVLEVTFGCCGNTGYIEYGSQTVPGTCCGYSSRQAACPFSIYSSKPGCNGEFVDFWYDNMDIIRWSGLGIVIFELLVFIFAGALTNCMRQENAGRQVSA